VNSSIPRIALTGGIATGKSVVRAHLERLGIPTSDADQRARDAVRPGTPALAAIVSRFGPSVLDSNGALNRKALADIVFTDPRARADLEAIVHPVVIAATNSWFEALDPATPFAVADIPLLYETGRDKDFQAVIVAACLPQTQLARLKARDGLSDAEARRRIEAQLPIDEKVRRADYIIRTDGSLQDTERATEAVFEVLKRRNWN
jgi:dephospho-CoA kinase